MTNSEFRLASSVELYDAGVIIRPNEHEGAGFLDDSMPGFKISGYTLDRLAKIFMIETTSVHVGRNRHLHLSRVNLSIDRDTHLYGDDFHEGRRLKAVYARIEGAHLLSLKIVEEWEHEGKVNEHTYEHVYSGSFNVEWAENE